MMPKAKYTREEMIGKVSVATRENSDGTESLEDIVEQIKELSEKLNEVVQG